MAGLLYYIPKQTPAITPKMVDELGLAYAMAGVMYSAAGVVQGGPDDDCGVILVDPKTVPKFGYYPNEQTWRKIPGSDVWVGMITDSLPSPADLVRNQVLPGHLVKLADGQEWLMPVARGQREEDDELRWSMSLPTAPTTVDENGKWVRGDVADAYRPLWETAMRFWDAWFIAEKTKGSDKAIMLFDNLNDAALLALATNYRVGMAEVSLLGLFDSDCVVEILKVLIDWPTLLAWDKKKTGRRWLEFSRWRCGLNRGYRPTVTDLFALTLEAEN